jgi:hypothetical protein
MGRLEALAGNRQLLEQAVRLLGRLDDHTYATGGAGPGVSPVGMHMRHVLDHYRALLDGLAPGVVDYEARHRDAPVERDRSLALGMTREILRQMEGVDAGQADRPLRINLQSMVEAEAGADWSQSTVKRELQFLVSHTVHHFALIRTLLRGTEFEPEEPFGVAPSTVAARQRETACAG